MCGSLVNVDLGEGILQLTGVVVCLLAALWVHLSISVDSEWLHNTMW